MSRDAKKDVGRNAEIDSAEGHLTGITAGVYALPAVLSKQLSPRAAPPAEFLKPE